MADMADTFSLSPNYREELSHILTEGEAFVFIFFCLNSKLYSRSSTNAVGGCDSPPGRDKSTATGVGIELLHGHFVQSQTLKRALVGELSNVGVAACNRCTLSLVLMQIQCMSEECIRLPWVFRSVFFCEWLQYLKDKLYLGLL